MKKLFKIVRLYPEIFAIPIAILGLVFLQKVLLWMDSTNAIYQDDWVQTIVMAAITILSGNALAHGAIKFNQPSVFNEYKTWLDGNGKMPQDYFKLLCLYLGAFGLIILAII
jgi:hypothetical protein